MTVKVTLQADRWIIDYCDENEKSNQVYVLFSEGTKCLGRVVASLLED